MKGIRYIRCIALYNNGAKKTQFRANSPRAIYASAGNLPLHISLTREKQLITRESL